MPNKAEKLLNRMKKRGLGIVPPGTKGCYNYITWDAYRKEFSKRFKKDTNAPPEYKRAWAEYANMPESYVDTYQ